MEEYNKLMKFVYEAAKLAIDQKGRQLYPLVAAVSDNKDPDNKRRIKVSDPTKGGKVDSEWIKPMRIMPQLDTPMPRIGDSVLLLFLNGDPLDGLYIPMSNETNQPLDKVDPINDLSQIIPGNEIKKVIGNIETTISGEISKFVNGVSEEFYDKFYKLYSKAEMILSSKTSMLVQGDIIASLASQGCSVTLTNGVITWSWANGSKTMTMVDGNVAMNLGGGTFSIIGASGASINGKQIATIGALDTRGDTLTTRGW